MRQILVSPSKLGALAKVVACFAVSAIFSALLAWFGSSVYVTLLVILVALTCGCVVTACSARFHSEIDSGFVALLIGNMCISIVLAILTSAIERPIIGTTLPEASVESDSGRAFGAWFRFTDAHVRSEFMGRSAVMGGSKNVRSHQTDTVFVAPLVPENWAREQPIHAWVVARQANLAEERKRWDLPVTFAVRVTGFSGSDYREAIEAATRIHQLRSSSDALLLHAIDSLDHEPRTTWARLGKRVVGAMVAYLVLLGMVVILGIRKKKRLARP